MLGRREKEKNEPKPGEQRGRRAGRVGADNASGVKRVPKSTQQLLGYQAMLPSGVAWLGADEWSLTLRISDINYLAAEQSTQEAIVDRWARFLNSFGAGTRLQVTVINRVLDEADVAQLVQKPHTGDGWDHWRDDFNRIVRGKLASASSNTVTEKLLTITVQEPDREKAEATLLRLGHETAVQLAALEEGCRADILDRTQRLEVLAHILRPHELVTFNEDTFQPARRLATADYVAPWAVETADSAGPLILHNGSGDTYHTVLWVRDYPVWLSDRLISELADIKCDLTVSLHLEPYDQADGMSLVQRQIAELEMQTIAEQKKARKQGYSEDLIPHKLQEATAEAKELRAELESSNQKVFSTVMVIGISGQTRESLDQNVKRAMTVIRKQSCVAEIATFMQRDALTTELPIGVRRIPMRRTLTTASAAIIVPFTTQELFVPGGNWYGVNAQSSNAVVADRTSTTNGNGFILGTSGSGKSVFGKMEIANVFLSRPDDDIIVIDPEREYEPVVSAFSGATIRVDTASHDRVNPMDIELEAAGDADDPITTKTQFVLSMTNVLIGGSDGLSSKQRSLVDRAAGTLYRRYAAEGGPMPTLVELRDALAATGDPDGAELATALEIYTTGSLGAFARRTNVDVHNRLISYDISSLGTELRTFGMLVILDQIWNRVVRNRARGRRTWLYIDEFHLLFSNRFSAEYFRSLYKRARKWGLIPTGITQNIEELLSNEDARLMLANSDFLMLLGQNATDADALCSLLHFSAEQRRYFTNVPRGNGLMKSGNTIIPIDGRIPTDSKLYGLFSTTFGD
ncbi:type IV secretion system protein VirB4 [Actinomyces sp. 594]|nr:type IV secretion system protein VirB4 [Actinomyces sp. 594]